MQTVDDILPIIPFNVSNIIDVRNFDNNIWKDTESILLLNNNGQI